MPGFVARHSSLLPDGDSKYSREGTEAHEYAKQCLILGVCEPSMFPSRELYRNIKGYVEIVEGWRTLPGAQLFIEEKVQLYYDDTNEGTTDAAAVTNDNRIFIGDYKHGVGKSVKAKRNPQITIYAVSFIKRLIKLGFKFNDQTVVCLMIYQPRVAGEEAVRLWVPTLRELMEYAEEIGAVASEIIFDPDGGAFSPDDETCQFCRGATLCKARTMDLLGLTPKATQMELLGPPPTVPQPYPEPENLTLNQLQRIVKVAPSLKEWLKKCEGHAARMLHEGKQFPGFKLVEGRSNRAWAKGKETAVASFLDLLGLEHDDAYTPSVLRSPAQIEDALKELGMMDRDTKEELVSYITKPPGQPTLVPEDDPRPQFDADPAADFEPLGEGHELLS